MNGDLTTKPTLKTILEMMRDLRDTMNECFTAVDSRLDAVDTRFDTLNGRVSELGIRIDRMDSWARKAYSVMTDLRTDFNELKVQLKEHLPSPK